MRYRALFPLAAAVTLAGLVGCGSASGIKEGVPKVDMSKNYTPAAGLAPVVAGDQKKAEAAKSGGAPAEPAKKK